MDLWTLCLDLGNPLNMTTSESSVNLGNNSPDSSPHQELCWTQVETWHWSCSISSAMCVFQLEEMVGQQYEFCTIKDCYAWWGNFMHSKKEAGQTMWLILGHPVWQYFMACTQAVSISWAWRYISKCYLLAGRLSVTLSMKVYTPSGRSVPWLVVLVGVLLHSFLNCIVKFCHS